MDILKQAPERLVGWLDPVFKPAADYTGIPAEDWTAAIGVEALGSLIDLPIDYFTTDLGGKVIKGIALVGSLGYTILGGLRGRAAFESLEFVGHFLNEVLDPKPETLTKVFGDLAKLQNGIRERNPNMIVSALVRTDKMKMKSGEATKKSERYEYEEVPLEEVPLPESEKYVPVVEEEGSEIVRKPLKIKFA